MDQQRHEELEVAIVGSGFSGIAMGVQLQRAGIERFRIFEKAHDVGGTWRENTYPGAACDIPSHLYSFSFAPNARWTRSYSRQPEILEYLRATAREHGLYPHITFGAEIDDARWDTTTGTWTIRAKSGETVRARSLVLGCGGLHIPQYPSIEGRDSFAGPSWHSATWRHDVDLRGKRVAVIGTGASAIQLVPQIAKDVARLHVFQRTPPWIVPKADRAIPPRVRELFARSPALMRAHRALLYWQHEARAVGFVMEPRIMELAALLAKRYLEHCVPDPVLRAKLTPKYVMGCKRVLPSNDYYPALRRSNVELVTEGIASIEPNGVRTSDGALREVDAIVYGTGFAVAEYLSPITIVGSEGQRLNDVWRDTAPEAYLGITVSGFPNLYLLMGPNTGLGHNSMVFMIESQARYARQCIEVLRDKRLRALDVRPSVQSAFNRTLEEKLRHTVWSAGCQSWYLAAGDGKNALTWPGFTFDYWRRTRRVDLGDFSAT
ncbi:flavin-containing monooxygenase [Sandaracinus amylolyticus]|uniref:Cyclohexanone monooxygenase n=1 Tax=Sandaracinus amylolyticus TaxID=927083 RepID=A0A0F6W0E3_9BACT|nr:NAD(P)/FAD-dependent oxidoreductase [Sandaracinus amylolyticus]AKF04090.1 Cyclohexanone monooxygenase [Sandaracinus amylolyticus]